MAERRSKKAGSTRSSKASSKTRSSSRSAQSRTRKKSAAKGKPRGSTKSRAQGAQGKRKRTKMPKGQVSPDLQVQARTRIAQQRFLSAYVDAGGIVTDACDLALVPRSSFYEWKEKYPEFVEALLEAQVKVNERLESELMGRVFVGVPEPVIYQGEPTLVYVDQRNGDIYGSKEFWEMEENDPDRYLELREHVRRQPLVVNKKDATTLIFALKGALPDKYRERTDLRVSGGLQVEDGKTQFDRDRELAAKVLADPNIRRLAASLNEQLALAEGEIVDAEIVEEEESA